MEADGSATALVITLVMIAGAIAWIWTIGDISRRTGTEWDASGQSQVLWVLLVVALGPVGSLLYVTIARPRLKETLLR